MQSLISILIPLAFGYYIGLQGWYCFKGILPGSGRAIYWLLYWFLTLLPWLLKTFGNSVSSNFAEFGASLAFTQLIFYGSLFCFTLIFKVFFLIAVNGFGLTALARASLLPLWPMLVIALSLAVYLYGYNTAKTYAITPYQITLAGAAAGEYKIAAISDLHLGVVHTRSDLKKMIAAVNALDADLVLILGDVLHGDYAPFRDHHMSEEFRNLTAPFGVYAVLGNHDAYANSETELMAELTAAGITMLQDKVLVIDDSFVLAGRQDRGGMRTKATNARATVAELLQGFPVALPVIVMDHQPQNLQATATEDMIDLLLNGHTHAGQFWPLTWITNRIYELNYGYRQLEDTQFIVTSGIGTWGPAFRLGSISEIALITLTIEVKQ
ncbi:MAG TPA: metallophosphoesterase [Bacillota bacterium]|nr:metallophosphoesterase [Bacillota bacterium]